MYWRFLPFTMIEYVPEAMPAGLPQPADLFLPLEGGLGGLGGAEVGVDGLVVGTDDGGLGGCDGEGALPPGTHCEYHSFENWQV